MTQLTEDLQHKLRHAIEHDATFYCYRLPNEASIVLSSNASAVEGFIEGGFVVSDFDSASTLTITDNPHEKTPLTSPLPLADIIMSDTPATLQSEHQCSVEHIVHTLNEIGYGKCVLSRLITGSISRPVSDTFEELLQRYPSAFVFIYNSSPTGMWIGATPETLLHASTGRVDTMSLAGTRKTGSLNEWDSKNLEEQDIVTQYIMSSLFNFGLDPSASELHTLQAGPVEHLCRLITSSIPAYAGFRLSELLKSLSPTPALGGYPKETALHLIKECERHPRQCYGGFIGPYHDSENFDFFVNLRSAKLFPSTGQYAKLVGGGITRFSRAADEWHETTMKAQTLML